MNPHQITFKYLFLKFYNTLANPKIYYEIDKGQIYALHNLPHDGVKGYTV